ncbi:MAG: ATP-dependent zinc metalloprotease FtsH [Pseudomonadota bacterium]
MSALIALGFLMLLPQFLEGLSGTSASSIAYSELKTRIESGEIAAVEITGDHLVATAASSPDGERLETYVPSFGDAELLPLLETQGVEVTSRPAPEGSSFGWLLPLVLIAGFYIWLGRRMTGGGMRFPGAGGGILGAKFWKIKKKDNPVTFAQVAGQEQAKREVAELVDFLRDPDRFARVGAKVPRGVLLMGPPGTGKTLLARALAGEADVPFYSTTGSAFIEVFVGVGAGRVRKMFEEARANAPSIIFIDELDSIGRVRGAGLGGGHDEREQTLNQILAELDGFDERVAVVVLAATNRPDVLDPALLRPGRFDRHVTLDLPDKNGRRAILDVHARNVPLAPEVDLDLVAAGTPGFSGADLKNLINEAAIHAARERDRAVRQAHLDQARDRVMMGTVRTLAIQPEEKHRIAVHEAGHAAAAFFLPNADPLFKVSIIPRGQSLGGTHMLPTEERHTLPEAYLVDQLSIMLGGRAAEDLFLGSVSSGADDDIARATALARSMIARWGMSDEIGPVNLRQSDDHPFLGRSIAQPRDFSDQTAAKVDDAVLRLLHEADEKVRGLIKKHKDRIEMLIAALETAETLDADAIATQLSPELASEDSTLVPLHRPPGSGA